MEFWLKNFDLIDAFIAKYHLDLDIAEEAMAIPSSELARKVSGHECASNGTDEACTWAYTGKTCLRQLLNLAQWK
jgi:propanediol dehydratase large subunit